MAHQATLSPGLATVHGQEAPTAHGEGLIGNLTGFGEDLFTLAELQGKLAVRDLDDYVGRATLPLVFAVLSAVVLAGAVPVALLGAADLVALNWGIGPGAAKLLVATVALAAAAVVLVVSARRMGSSFQVFRRSGEELTRNLAWARTVLVYSGRPARNRKP